MSSLSDDHDLSFYDVEIKTNKISWSISGYLSLPRWYAASWVCPYPPYTNPVACIPTKSTWVWLAVDAAKDAK